MRGVLIWFTLLRSYFSGELIRIEVPCPVRLFDRGELLGRKP